ncbi:MAG TPA: cyclase family protein [Methanomicrobiales archaeon]|nr:cyclase family protein [Methanomicrobiales archaeon]
MLIPLSYPLTLNSPLYPGTPVPAVRPYNPPGSGTHPRSSIISVHSHSGTHIDLPPHFCPEGIGNDPLSPPGLTFFPARCIGIPLDPASTITPGLLIPHLPSIRDAAAILVRTGSGAGRSTDPEGYASSHPRVDPSVPAWLRAESPGLRLFGIDAISIADPSHRDEGRACHREFLCGSPPILILEDADLEDDRILDDPWTLHLFPLLAEWIDGLPVVAIADTGDALWNRYI